MARRYKEIASTRWLREAQRTRAQMVRAAARVEVWFDTARWSLRERFGKLGTLQVVTYRGFGTRERVVVRGRVLEGEEPRMPTADARPLTNLRYMIRRFKTQELPNASVRASLGAASLAGQTDEEGYFQLWIVQPRLQDGDAEWHQAEVELVACNMRGFTPVSRSAEVLIPAAGAEFGIISDIDDTVLQTHVTRRLKMLMVTFFGNAYTRLPFEGTTELYRALKRGSTGTAQNPVFYISKSPWNLYEFLTAFMDQHDLPRGPLFLRDFGLRNKASLDFKTQCIAELFDTYRDLSFVLIGDSGERDPDIYLEIAARYPGRVKAIYIRQVNENPLRELELRAMPEQARKLGCEMLLVEHASEALEHACRLGLATRGT